MPLAVHYTRGGKCGPVTFRTRVIGTLRHPETRPSARAQPASRESQNGAMHAEFLGLFSRCGNLTVVKIQIGCPRGFAENHSRCLELEIGNVGGQQSDSLLASSTSSHFRRTHRGLGLADGRLPILGAGWRVRTHAKVVRQAMKGVGPIYLATDSPIGKRGAQVARKGLNGPDERDHGPELHLRSAHSRAAASAG